MSAEESGALSGWRIHSFAVIPLPVEQEDSPHGRQRLGDGLYGVAVNLQRTGQLSRARYVGNATGVRVDWRVQQHVSYSLITSRFFTGAFLRQTPPGQAVAYFSSWVTLRF